MKSIISLFMASAMLFLLFSCEKNENPQNETYTISGYAQKGPFAMGSQVLISEYDAELVPTGRTFSTQTVDNAGKYMIENVELESNYVLVRIDGFYFNEVSGELSESQLSLSGIMDLSLNGQQNLNILTHLEQDRILYLVEQGSSFASARSQAHGEVLQMLELSDMETEQSEHLDMSGQGNDNAMLLAASIILQGKRTTAELSELINQIGLDLREDGQLDNPEMGTQLINHAYILNLDEIRDNIEQRYVELGAPTTIAGFEDYLLNFTEETDFERDNDFTIPETGGYGANALHASITQVENASITDRYYSFAVQVPEHRTFMVKTSGGLCAYAHGSEVNFTNYYELEPVRFSTYTTTDSGLCDVSVRFDHALEYPRIILLEFFADGNTEPFLTKELEIVDNAIAD